MIRTTGRFSGRKPISWTKMGRIQGSSGGDFAIERSVPLDGKELEECLRLIAESRQPRRRHPEVQGRGARNFEDQKVQAALDKAGHRLKSRFPGNASLLYYRCLLCLLSSGRMMSPFQSIRTYLRGRQLGSVARLPRRDTYWTYTVAFSLGNCPRGVRRRSQPGFGVGAIRWLSVFYDPISMQLQPNLLPESEARGLARLPMGKPGRFWCGPLPTHKDLPSANTTSNSVGTTLFEAAPTV